MAGNTEFERKLAAEQEAGTAARLSDEPPPGMLPSGELNAVEEGAPRARPAVTASEPLDVEEEVGDLDLDEADEALGS